RREIDTRPPSPEVWGAEKRHQTSRPPCPARSSGPLRRELPTNLHTAPRDRHATREDRRGSENRGPSLGEAPEDAGVALVRARHRLAQLLRPPLGPFRRHDDDVTIGRNLEDDVVNRPRV